MAEHDHLRVGAIEQADAYLSAHRKSEVWRLIDRLRDELVRASSQVQATRAELDVALAADTVQCPTCRGGGRIAVGPWGVRPPKIRCELCQGKGTLARNVAEAFRVGVEMGRSSAYIGHYDQYDTGSLMFSAVDSPYEPGVEIKGEVNGRTGF